MLRSAGIVFALFLLLVVPGCGRPDAKPRTLRLATTTSTQDSGLLDVLLPPFEARHGVRVDVLGVGTGEALARARRGDADVVLVHARKLEDRFVADGHGVDRRDVMWNDFLIAGPAGDPAGAKGAATAAEALARVERAGATFVSRGDGSGTHVREEALWAAAGGLERWDDYVESGQGMGATLTVADEMDAYVLVDRGTWLARRGGLRLAALVEGDPALHNPYGVIRVDPSRHPHVNAADAVRLADYLTSPGAQRRIGEFRVGGEILFHPVRGD